MIIRKFGINKYIICIGKEGEEYGRQNFYFKVMSEGNENLVMKYESKSPVEDKDDGFEINFNITIQRE